MYGNIKEHLQKELSEIKEAGLFKKERIITSSQDAVIKISTGEEVINFCANNYGKHMIYLKFTLKFISQKKYA